jgi:hypothetical protein
MNKEEHQEWMRRHAEYDDQTDAETDETEAQFDWVDEPMPKHES